jgi:hypothetical protein
MSRTVLVLILSAAMLATAGFASTETATGGSGYTPLIRLTPAPSPAPAVQAPAAGNTGPTTVRWDKFYDRSGNPLPSDPQDAVGADSLYWKDYSSTTYLKSSAKVQNPSPVNRTAMSFHDADATTCMDPTGDYVYEVNGTSLYRFSTVDGSMTTYTLAYTGGLGCATDGQYIYRPSGSTMYKYTMTGVYVNSTTTNSCDAYSISCCRDTSMATPVPGSPVAASAMMPPGTSAPAPTASATSRGTERTTMCLGSAPAPSRSSGSIPTGRSIQPAR